MAVTVGMCDNCGSADEERWAVQRVYLVPEPVTETDIEQWCSSCLSQYPHHDVD